MAEIDNTAEELFFKLRNRFPRITTGDENGKTTVDPRQGRFFNFDFELDGKKYGKITCSLIDPTSLKIYFSQGITEQMDEVIAAKWFAFLREMRRFSKVNMLTFDVRDISKDSLGQEDIEFSSKYHKGKSSAPVSESKIHWARRGRFSEGNHKSIKIHVVHKNKMNENPNNRLIQVDKLYLVNEKMERFLLPFTSITGAKAMANHVARNGTPYDEGGLSIAKAVAEMKNLQRFATVTRNKEFESVNTHKVIDATRYVREELRKHLKRMAGGRFFEHSLDAVMTLTKASDHRQPTEIKDWFVQKYYNENIDSYLESAAHAYNKYEEHEMNTLKEATSAVAQKILDPNYLLVLKAEDAIDSMIRNGTYTNKMALVTRALMDIADRLIVPDGDDLANFAAMMSDKISSEGEAFGQRPDEEYNQQKALAIKLASKYISDMNKMQADPSYKDSVRKDPTATMGAKKDRKGIAKTPARAFEDEIMAIGEEQLDELNANQIKKDLDSGMSMDAVIGKHANKSMSNTDEIRKVIKQHAWDKRMKKTNEDDLDEVGDRDPHHRFRSLKRAHRKLGEEPNEGNEFSGALAKAKAAGAKTFKVGSKSYDVKESLTSMTEQGSGLSYSERVKIETGLDDLNRQIVTLRGKAVNLFKFMIARESQMTEDESMEYHYAFEDMVENLKAAAADLDSVYMDTSSVGPAASKNSAATESAKPDFLDVDKDGNKTEPMKKALRDKAQKSKSVDEATGMSSGDAVKVLGNLRKIGKQIADLHQDYQGNFANEYATGVYEVYTWLQANADANDPAFKTIMQPVLALRAEAKKLGTMPGSGSNKSFANQAVNALYPLMTWIEDNVGASAQHESATTELNWMKRLSGL